MHIIPTASSMRYEFASSIFTAFFTEKNEFVRTERNAAIMPQKHNSEQRGYVPIHESLQILHSASSSRCSMKLLSSSGEVLCVAAPAIMRPERITYI